MRVEMFLINTENSKFIINNSAKHHLIIAEKVYENIGCNRFDILLNDENYFKYLPRFSVVHKSYVRAESEALIKAVYMKLNEKLQLLMQVQALKKIKDDEMLPIIERIKKQIRDEYFEVRINDLLDEIYKGKINVNRMQSLYKNYKVR